MQVQVLFPAPENPLSKESGFFILHIADNGIGMEEKRLADVKDAIKNGSPTEKDIYGLYNVNERIRLNFGEKYGISIQSRYMQGTRVSVILPYLKEGESL